MPKFHLNLTGYRSPVPLRIGREPGTEGLYAAEHKVHERLQDVGEEWKRVTGNTEFKFFQEVLPQVLFDLLDSYDTKAAYTAAKAYIKHVEDKWEVPSV